jgi:hypothetical protein
MTENREPAAVTEVSCLLRTSAVAKAVQWSGDNIGAMEALLGPHFDYNDDNNGVFDASVLTSAHHTWQEVYPGDWAVVEGERIAVCDPAEFAEQFVAGKPSYEWRVSTGGVVWPMRDEAGCRDFGRKRAAQGHQVTLERSLLGAWEVVEL